MDQVYKLGAVLTLKDYVSSQFDKITSSAEKLKSKFKELDGGIATFESRMKQLKIGTGMLAAGTGMAFFSKSLIDANKETSQFQSYLKSLNVSDENIDRVTQKAMQMSSTFNITRNEFIDAAYDIKSGIATINDSQLGAFTVMVAKAAAATKGNTKELASVFGTIYNQNKKFYKNLSDEKFGEVIANSLAFAVQQYKTEGSKMQQAIESVSGAAAAAGYDIAEQFNVLGMLQNVMQPGEAGTGFRAFVSKAYEAGQKLGLSFVDAEGKLLPVVDIIEKLKTKYGETVDEAEKLELSKAFGSEEAQKLFVNLWDKTDLLRENIEKLRTMKGAELVDAMAKANIDNINTSLITLSNTWDNFKSTLGSGIGWALKPFIDALKGGLEYLVEIGNKYPTLSKIIGIFLSLGSALTIVIGAYTTLKAITGLYALSQIAAGNTTQISTLKLLWHKTATLSLAVAKKIATGAVWLYLGALKVGNISSFIGALVLQKGIVLATAAATKIASVAQWLFNAALWGCPVMWIVGGIALIGAGAYLLIKHWNKVAAFFGELWNSLKSMVGKAISFVLDAGKKLIDALWNGIKSSWNKLKNGIRDVFGSIANLFPHSDAKEGPFSKLTLSGQALIKTFNTGIEIEAKKKVAVIPYMQKTVETMQAKPSAQINRNASSFVINVAHLIGNLTIQNESKNGTLQSLANAMAQAIMQEIMRYSHA
ncbi:MAG: phage tail tape measure protein [Spirochaetota bacterium]|nr:phage tail tape measure protein [Spirochaetota bacterium]